MTDLRVNSNVKTNLFNEKKQIKNKKSEDVTIDFNDESQKESFSDIIFKLPPELYAIAGGGVFFTSLMVGLLGETKKMRKWGKAIALVSGLFTSLPFIKSCAS